MGMRLGGMGMRLGGMGMRLGCHGNEATMIYEWDYSGLGTRTVFGTKDYCELMLNGSLISALLRKRLIFHWMQIFWMSTKERMVSCSCLI